MQTTTLKAPFAWVGGKSKLAKEIVQAMQIKYSLNIKSTKRIKELLITNF